MMSRFFVVFRKRETIIASIGKHPSFAGEAIKALLI